MSEEIIIKISKPEKFQELIQAFPGGYKVEKVKSFNSTEYYYDSFDWRLFNRNLAFIHTGSAYSLVLMGTNKKRVSGKSREVKSKYFPGQFNKITAEALKELLQHRALLKICRCRNHCNRYNILNADEKTVIKLDYCDHLISNNDKSEYQVSLVRMIPLRGYGPDLKKITSELYNAGFAVEGDNYLEFIYKYFGRVPGQFSSKIRILLDGRMSTGEAVRLILIKLVEVIFECENGIINDLDIEFLHDYRVSIRKARALLSELKNTLQPELMKELKSIFGIMGKKTNDLRDLDVYLLNQSVYESYLPSLLKKGLSPLFEKIRKERNDEYSKLKRDLNSAEYKNNMLQLGILLEEDFESDQFLRSKQPVITVSKKLIASRYRKILKSGRAITAESEDAVLHELRLECKKLRYLLELFSSLFPFDKVEFLIGQLKLLQDNLGEFNDLSVQQEKLSFYLNEIKENSKENMKLATVIGGVITSLHNRQKEVRDLFFETFGNFDSKENRDMIKKMFLK